MSQTYSETSLVSSNETLQTVEFESILALLRDAAADATKNNDFLLYSTALDIHLSEPSKYSNEERERLLQHLLETLAQDKALVYEIGWDIPSLVIPFVDTSFDFTLGLRSAPCITEIFKILDVLVRDGNPKELFLKANELLSSTKASDSSEDVTRALKFYDIKLHCIFELINGCFRRIQTLYPSRFLSMTVSSVINALHLNPQSNDLHLEFVMKRIYTLARNYAPPLPPPGTKQSSAEVKKVIEDEEYLQRTLLTAFVSYSVSILLQKQLFGYSVAYFESLQSPDSTICHESYSLDVPIMERYYNLLTSFDIQLEDIFSAFAKSSAKLVLLDIKDSDAYTEKLFERLVIDYLLQFANSILDPERHRILDSLAGFLLVYTFEVSSNGLDATFASRFSLSLEEAMAMTLRLVIPGMIHPSLCHLGLHDVAIFWCWFVVHQLSRNHRALELELSRVPRIIVQTFWQSLLFVIVSSQGNSQMRYVTLTLLTRFLSSANEESAYGFLISSLDGCPYENVKPALVATLKALLVNDKPVKDLSEDLESLSLAKTTSQPPLPKRNTNRNSKFISLNPGRINALLELTYSCIELSFIDNDGQLDLNSLTFSTLLSFLNMLVCLKRSGLIPANECVQVISTTQDNIDKINHAYKDKSSKADILNATNLLSIALSRLDE